MKKTIESEIRQIATELSQHTIIGNTSIWKEKVWKLYDKLCVLDYLEKQLNLTESSINSNRSLTAVNTNQISDTEEIPGELEDIFNEVSHLQEKEMIQLNEALDEADRLADEFEIKETQYNNQLTDKLQKVEKPKAIKIETKEESKQKENLLFAFDEETDEEINTPIIKSDELQRFAEQYPNIPTFSRKENTHDNSITTEQEEKQQGEEHEEEKEQTSLALESVSNYENTFIKPTENRTRSLNDSINRGLHIGINDRLAFQKHLFNNSPDDFNRVLSQINTFQELNLVKEFIQLRVKPEYNNWEGKEDYETRFLNLVEKKFI